MPTFSPTVLGNRLPQNLPEPQQFDNNSWLQVSAFNNFAGGIRDNSLLYMWGTNNTYQVGDGTTLNKSLPVQISNSSFSLLSAGFDHSAALTTDNTLFMWGNNASTFIQTINFSWNSISSNGGHNIAIRNDGLLFTWGLNSSGQLGDGTTINRSSPVQIGTSSYTFVAAGNDHSLAVIDKSLYAWGLNSFFQNGQGTTTANRSSPVLVTTAAISFVSVSAGNQFNAYVLSDGSLYTFGKNNVYQLGDSITTSRSNPVAIGTERSYVSVSAGFDHSVAIDTVGNLYLWGNQASTFAPIPTTISSWSQVSAGDLTTAGLTTTGKAYFWGSNATYGMLGTGDTLNRSSPTQLFAGTSSFIQVASQQFHSASIDTQNRLYTWGFNDVGQLGIGLTTNRSTPQQVNYLNKSYSQVALSTRSETYAIDTSNKLWSWGLNNVGQGGVVSNNSVTWSTLAVGSSFIIAVKSDGTLWGWGRNSEGQLGQGDTILRSLPTQIGSSSWKSVAAGPQQSFAIRDDNLLYAWGTNSYGNLGDNSTVNKSTPNLISSSNGVSNYVQVNAVGEFTFAIDYLGRAWSWGRNNVGQLGINLQATSLANRSNPVQISFPAGVSIIQITAGDNGSATGFGLAVTTTNLLYAWGENTFGQLGDNTTINKSSPVQIGTDIWNKVTATHNIPYSAAIRNDGSLFTWGHNTNGGLGLGDTINRSSPVQVAGLPNSVVTVAFGSQNTALLLADGTIWGMGTVNSRSAPAQIGNRTDWNFLAQTNTTNIAFAAKDINNYAYVWGNEPTIAGTGQTSINLSAPVLVGYAGALQPNLLDRYSSPTQVASTSSWSQIVAGDSFALAIDSNYKLFGWGNNSSSQIGDNTTFNQYSPVQIGNSSWISVSAGLNHALAVRSDNTLWTWGSSTAIGLVVEPQSFITAASGNNNTYAIDVGGRLWAWGDNTAGQLGNLATGNRSSPVMVGFNVALPGNSVKSNYTQVFAGNSFAFATDDNSKLFAWGNNNVGQLGLNSTLSRSFPLQVGTSSWNSVAAGTDHTIGLDSTNSIYGWGQYTTGQTGIYDTVYSWTQVAGGLALRADNTLWSWGNNVGDGTTTFRSIPVQLGSTDWSSIAMIYDSTFVKAAIKTNGTLWIWGTNTSGQLGDGTTINQSSPVQVAGSWSQISIQSNHAAALDSSSIMYTWGLNDKGQLGDGTTINKSSPVLLTATGGFSTTSWLSVSVGYSHTTALNTSRVIYSWGDNSSGQLGINLGTAAHRSNPTILTGTSSWTMITSGALHVHGITAGALLWSWGSNANGQTGLNVGVTVNRSSPTQVSADTMYLVYAGSNYSLAIRRTGQLFSWGANDLGQLGQGDITQRSSPTIIGALTSWIKVGVNSAIDSTNSAYVWGANTGILETIVNSSSPVQVGGLRWPVNKYYVPVKINNNSFLQIGVGNSFSIGLDSNNILYGWGLNTSGQLGDTTTVTKFSPTLLNSFSWLQVAVGYDHTLAIRQDTTLWTWGNSGAISLGVEPQSWTAISAGSSHTLAIRSDGALFTWGLGTSGALGDNSVISKSSPTVIGSSSWSQVAAGQQFSLALDINNYLYTWGVTNVGQTGRIGVARSNPTQIFNFVDKSSYSNTLDNFDTTYTSDIIPFTGAVSGVFRQNSQAITVPTGNEFAFGTGDFTIEGWVWANFNTPPSATNYAFGYGSYLNENAIRIGFDGNVGNNYRFSIVKDVPGSTVGTSILSSPMETFFAQTWYHLAVVRQSGTLTAYINGINRGSIADTTDYDPTYYGFRIGAFSSNAGGGATAFLLNGNISNVRVVKGVAVYTGNFTVPTSVLTETQSAGTNISAITAGQCSLLALTDSTSISMPTYTSINAGASHAYAIDSTNKLFGWGLNTSGQVMPYGNYPQNTYNSSAPVQVDLGYFNNFGLAASSAAIRNPDRFIFVWGANSSGELGLNDTINRSVPTQMGNLSWKQVAKGFFTTLAIRDDDTLWTWGIGQQGVLGNNSTLNRSSPVQVEGGGSWKYIAVGPFLAAGIKTDGTLWTWGRNNLGQLGDNTTINKSIPVQVAGGGSWKNVSVGNSFMLAVDSNSLLYGWGINAVGQLGNNTTIDRSAPTLLASPFNVASFTQVAAGDTHTLAITTTGLLYVWGGSTSGELGIGVAAANRSNPIQITQSPGVVGEPFASNGASWAFVAAGFQASAAIYNNNLYVWGLNTQGRLGLGDTLNRSFATQTGVGYSWQSAKLDVLGTSASGFFRSDNTLWYAGDNSSGQIGDNTIVNKSAPVFLGAASFSTPVQINNSSWSIVSAGTDFTHAINSTGQLYNWGLNSVNQLGNVNTTNRNDALVQVLGSWSKVSSGTSHSLAIKSDSTLWAWGGASAIVLSNVTANSWIQIASNDNSSHCAAIRSDGTLWVWGLNTSGQIGDGTTVNKSSPTQIGAGSWSFVSVGTSNTMAVKVNGDLYAWGNNATGQLGDNSVISKSSPVFVAYGSFTQVALNGGYALTLKSGTPYVWGLNSSGQLGLNDTINRSTPVILSSPTIVAMSASSSNFSLGITDLGVLYAWGNNATYQLGLGDNTTTNRSNPTLVPTPLLSFTTVSAGASHSLALDTNSKVWTWGQGSSIGADFNSWTQISSGELFALALRSDGRLFTWGLNSSGQLGQGDVVNRSNPVAIGGSSWTLIDVGTYNAFAIRADNTLWGWGLNSGYAIGDGTSVNKLSPVQIGANISVPSWKQVSAGISHTVGIASDDKLYVWGTNTLGVLGLGDTLLRSVPTILGANSWTSISAGATHTIAVNSLGQMFTWGANNLNQLGDNTFVNQSSPIQIGFSRSNATLITTGSWTQLSAGLNHSLAISAEGRLFTWGNQNAILLTPQLQSWSQISAGDNGAFTLGIRSDGLLYGWGLNSTGQLGTFDTLNRSSPTLVSGLGWKRVATGTAHSIAIRQDDTLWAWGNNATWQLGDGLSVNRSSPVQIGTSLGSSWTSVAAGSSHSGAIDTLGRLYMWGAAAGGAIGDNQTAANRSSPTLIGNSSWTSVSLGNSFTTAITSIGTLFAWGLNSLNQLGDATTINKSSPVQIGGGLALSFINVSSGFDHAAAITNNYKLYAWGSANAVSLQNSIQSWTTLSAGSQHTLAIRSDGLLYAWGLNSSGQLGDSTTVTRSSPVLITSDSSWFRVTAGTDYTLAIKADRTLWVWGLNTSGQLGDNTIVSKSSPILVSTGASSYTQISAGSVNNLAIDTDFRVWSWGVNNAGQLGDGTTVNKSNPVLLNTTIPSTTSSYTQISAGNSFAAVIDTANELFMFGLGSLGRLGNNTTINRSVPTIVRGSASFYTQVASGFDHTLATAATSSNLFSWGNNIAGQLGTTNTVNRSNPAQVSQPATIGSASWGIIAAGNSWSFASIDNKLYAWGLGSSGQLGTNTSINRSQPTAVTGIGSSSWTTISAGAGGTHAIGIQSTGLLYGWGLGTSGQVGDNTSISRSVPVIVGNTALNTSVPVPTKVGDSSWTQVAAGNSFTSAIRSDFTIWSWGLGTNGQLGNNSAVSRSSPVQVSGAGTSSWTQVVAGGSHALAISTANLLYGWGLNSSGQLGDITVTQRNVPTIVSPTTIAASQYPAPTLIDNTNSYVQIAAGTSYSAALRSDYTLYVWGLNTGGQLGDNTTITKSSPTLLAASTVNRQSWTLISTAASASGLSAISNQKIFNWGLNSSGQIGDNATINRSSPVQVFSGIVNNLGMVVPTKINLDISFTQISAGTSYSLARKAVDRTIVAWGTNQFGQYGDGTTVSTSYPVMVGQSPIVTDISQAALTVTTPDGTPKSTIDSPFASGSYNVSTYGGSLYLNGSSRGLIAADSTLNIFANVSGCSIEIWFKPTASGADQMILTQDSGGAATAQIFQLFVTATNFLSFTYFTTTARASAVTLTSTVKVNLNSWNHALVTLTSATSGTLRLILNGVLENFATSVTPYAVTARATGIGSFNGSVLNPFTGFLTNLRMMNGSIPTDYQTASTTIGATIFTVPTSPLTESSQGATSTDVAYLGMRAIPQYTPSNVVAIGSTTAFLDTDSTIDIFGLNASGQFGNGTTVNRSLPVILGQNFTGLNTGFNVPIKVATQNSWTAVSAGTSFSLARNVDTFAYAWGLGTSGQLGRTFSAITRSAPTIVGPNQSVTVLDSSIYTNTVVGSGTFYDTVNVPAVGAVAGTFNGTSDYLRSDSVISSIGSVASAFTIEGYAYVNAYPELSTGRFLIGLNSISTGANNILLGVDRLYYDGSLVGSGGSYQIPLNTWTHFAFSYTGTTYYWFINGVLITSAANQINSAPSSNTFLIGAESDGSNATPVGNYFSGSLSSLRWTNKALYTGAFTPPTGILTTTSVGTSGPNVAASLSSSEVGFLTYTTYAASINVEATPAFSLIDAGAAYGLGIQTDNKLYAWGLGSSGQLGLGDAVSRSSITLVGATGQIINTYTTSPVQVTPGTSGYTQVYAGQSFSYVSDNLGQTYFWGLNSSGQLGDNTAVGKSNLTLAVTGTLTILDVSDYNQAITNKGSSYTNLTAFIPFTGAVSGFFNSKTYLDIGVGANTDLPGDYTCECWFYALNTSSVGRIIAYGEYHGEYGFWLDVFSGDVRFVLRSSGSTGTTGLILGAIATKTWYHVAIVRTSGVVTCYLNGILAVTNSTARAALPYSTVNGIRLGAGNLTNTWSPNNYFYGYISNFRLVKGVAVYTGNFTVPTSPLAKSQPSGTNISAITSSETSLLMYNDSNSIIVSGTIFNSYNLGNTNTLALSADSKLYIWGANPSGQLGIGNVASRSSPVLLGNGEIINTGTQSPVQVNFGIPNSWTAVAAGKSFSLAKDIAGSVYAWGLNSSGQLGMTDTLNRSSPILVGASFTGILDISTYNSPITKTGTSYSTSNVPVVGSVSGYYDGVSNYIVVVPTDTNIFNFGSGNFTVECWFYISGNSSTDNGGDRTAALLSIDNRALATLDFGWGLVVQGDANTTGTALTFFARNSGVATFLTYNGTITQNLWHHVAVSRINSSMTIYYDGVNVAQNYDWNVNVPNNGYNLRIGRQLDAAYNRFFNGYISNVRVVKGVGVYTGNFTVPTTVLAVTQSSSGSLTQTSLLALQNTVTGDNSANALTLTATGSPTSNTNFSPFLSNTTNFSGVFNGTSNYLLMTPGGSQLLLGTGDFTIEAWVYHNGSAPGGGVLNDRFIWGNFNATTNEIGFFLTNGSLAPAFWDGTTQRTSSSTVSPNTWTHISVNRISNNISFSVNGVVNSQGTSSVNFTNNTSFAIGRNNEAANRYFPGYISNLRITKGIAVYTGNFTVSTSPLSKTQVARTNVRSLSGTETALLTLQNATIIDNSNNAISISNINTVTVSSTVTPTFQTAKTNGNSVYFTGSTQYLNAPSNAVFTFGTGDFTIECWVYLIVSTTSGTLYDGRTGASTVSPQLYISSNIVYYAVGGSDVITGTTITADTWHHIAVVKISGNTILYINGVQEGSTYTDSNDYVIGSPFIGTGFSSSNPLNGFITNLRVVKGVGVYTGNFTVPTTVLYGAQITAITGTETTALTYTTQAATIIGGVPSYYAAIAAGGSNSVGTYLDNTLYTWGLGTSGQLGIDSAISRSGPVLVGNQLNSNTISPILAASASWSQASAGVSYSLAINADGSLWAWGLNNTYQLGQGDLINRSSIVQVGSGLTGFTDQSTNSFTIVANGNAYMLEVSPFANGSYDVSIYGGSGSFDGTGDYLTLSSNNSMNFGIDNFTIEGWFFTGVKTLSGTASRTIIGNAGNGYTMQVYISTSGFMTFGNTGSISLQGATDLANSIWHHFAIARTGTGTNQIGMWVDGIRVAQGTNATNYVSSTIYIGAFDNINGGNWNGYISNLRIVKGVAVYDPVNSTITVPIAPLTAISGTQLLTASYINTTLYYSKIVAGNSTSMAIKTDGSLSTWGLGTSGILGYQSVTTRSVPTQVGTSSWSLVSSGLSHALGVESDSTLFAWGGNTTGQLGTNTTITRSSPVQVQGINLNTTSPTLVDGNWTNISAGLSYTAGLQTDGTLGLWGLNSSGQLGDGTTINKSSPVSIGATYAIADASVNNKTISSTGAKLDTNVVPFNNIPLGPTNNGVSYSFNLTKTGPQRFNTDELYTSSISGYAVGAYTNYTIEAWVYLIATPVGDGAPIYTLGAGGSAIYTGLIINSSSQIAFGAGTGGWSWAQFAAWPTPTMPLNTWRHIAVVKTGTTVKIFFNGTTVGSITMATIPSTQSGDMFIGSYFNDYNNNGGYLRGYISNFRMVSNAALYTSDFTVPTSPLTAVTGTQLLTSYTAQGATITDLLWTNITAGSGATYGIISDGNLYAWGLGTTGQTSGFASAINRSAPGQIGNQYISLNMSSPVQIAAGSWSKVSAGISSSAAIRQDYKLFTWGVNTVGKLGDGTTILKSSPVQIGTSSWTQVSASASHTAALDSAGRLFIWGLNSSGQLGLTNINVAGDTVNRSSPVLVGSAFIGVLDVSTNALTITRTGTSFSNTIVPIIGSVSGSFSGTNEYLTITNPSTNLREWWNTDFTVECWIYPTTLSGTSYNQGGNQTPSLIGNMSTTNDGNYWSFGPISNGTVRFYYYTGVSVFPATSTETVVVNQWNHIAFTNVAGVGFKYWVNGIGSSNITISGTPLTGSDNNLTIGWKSFSGGSAGFTGNVSNIRIVKGVAVYTGNFVVPTSILTATQSAGVNISAITGSQTSLLTYTTQAATIVGGSPTYFNKVTVGQSFTAATTTTNTLFMWGAGTTGILGNNATINRSSPVQATSVGTNSWTLISGGGTFTGGIQSNGVLYMWGTNSAANFGDIWYNAVNRSNPIQFGNTIATTAAATRVPIKNGNSSWTQVSAGNSSSIGLFYRNTGQNGLLFTWGLNSSGQLGDNTTINKSSPVQIGVNTYLSVTTGQSNAGAIGKATT